MRCVRPLYLVLMIGAITFCAKAFYPPADESPWTVQTSGIRTNLRGISAAYASWTDKTPVVWASGSNGVILRSPDAGKTWVQLSVAGGEKLDFRGIQAIDAETAYAMSIGGGDSSRIYKTSDAGKTWKLEYSDKRTGFFLDAIVCSSEKKCFALSDPVDGKFLVIATQDGEHWNDLPRETMPAALSGEGAFAAGNSALAVFGGGEVYFGTGGGASSRVFHTVDMGRTWTATATPITAGIASAGIFSIARSGDTVVVVGGDYRQASLATSAAAYSTDRGATWHLAAGQPGGYRSGVASIDARIFVAAGPNGEDISLDGGARWTNTGAVSLNAVAALDAGNVWGAGANGTVARYKVPEK
ncbi:MAG TPA: YCF48-related protein [Candidatus Acidoferrales bacterium]|nr:YCF48-related protein [Candidatus Acidoferrales bacterium]